MIKGTIQDNFCTQCLQCLGYTPKTGLLDQATFSSAIAPKVFSWNERFSPVSRIKTHLTKRELFLLKTYVPFTEFCALVRTKRTCWAQGNSPKEKETDRQRKRERQRKRKDGERERDCLRGDSLTGDKLCVLQKRCSVTAVHSPWK